MKRLSAWSKLYLVLWAGMVVAGGVARIFHRDLAAFGLTAISGLLFMGLVISFGSLSANRGAAKAALALLGVGVWVALAQTVLANSGLFFSGREFPSAQPLSIHFSGSEVPLLSLLLPVVLISASTSIASAFGKPAAVPVLSAGIAALVEIPLDPVAADALNAWNWVQKGPIVGAPWGNVLSWFCIALVGSFWMALLLGTKTPRDPNPNTVLFSTASGLLLFGSFRMEKSVLLFVPVFILLLFDSFRESHAAGVEQIPAKNEQLIDRS